MARVTQEHLDARRRQILEAAARQFGRRGLEPGAATIDDIASEAGLSKGSIYSYFKNKDELLGAIMDAAVEYDRTLFDSASEESGTSWEAFLRVARQVWDRMVDPDEQERSMLMFDQMLLELRHDSIDDRYVSVPVDALSTLLAGAQREGKVAADLNSRVLATTLWNCQQGTRAYILRTGDTEMANASLELLRDLLTRSAGSSAVSPEGVAD
ncbi:MAG: TetR/AcrR family transcriptional regulator [Dehalococcoidia bacterium]|jgi:TetR/AcrR family transcriptional regulator, transcriptional repressor of aconitase|nr:TetR/AcrR family transcriptional regulator [Dehalococcoidia bacterium]